MSNWNHSMCDDCWNSRDPQRLPCKVIDAKTETCCFCGKNHASGIYIRQDPKTLRCAHNAADSEDRTMTEDDAKTKWCPMVRLRSMNEPVLKVNDRCIGSACMAWRMTDNEFEPQPESSVSVPQVGKPAGYCGLASR